MTKFEKELCKVNRMLILGHNFYKGKPIAKVIRQLEFEIYVRTKYGDKSRESFLKN